MNKGSKTSRSVIAAVKDDTQFKAVELRAQDGTIEILWAKAVPGDDSTWSDLAVECGLAAKDHAQARSLRKDVTAVVGLDSTAVAFYKISAPAVSEEETAAIVRMQIESLLPLPPEQIEVAWRTSPSIDGKVDVTIAAARCDHLERFLDGIRDLRPRHVLLACEGTAHAWRSLFAESERQAALLSIGERNTQICLVRAGRVVHAAVLDMGMNDLASTDEDADPPETLEATERFALDVRTILDSFGWEVSARWPIFVLSDGSEAIDRVVASLNAAGLLARTSLPGAGELKMPPDFELSDVYRYRTPLGLALLAMEEPAERLDLFKGLLGDQPQVVAMRARYSIVIAAAVAVFMLIALIATSYAVDKSRDSHYKKLLAQTDLGQARQRQELLKTVAQHRPDVLQLLTDINSGQNNGIVLDSFQFKKGQPVSLVGQADNQEQLWSFQKNLRGHKGIENAEISNVSQDTKTKKVRFTITFHYKGYTKKNAVL
jgi:hypothetical protein